MLLGKTVIRYFDNYYRIKMGRNSPVSVATR